MKITLIGLGISNGDLTLRAKEALDGATAIIARTSSTESFKSLSGYKVRTLDELFSKSRNFDSLNKKLAAEVIKASRVSPVCYCVDGSVSEDEACKIILSKARDCEVLDSVSKSANAYNAGRLDKSAYTSVSAYSVSDMKSCRAACIFDIDCYLVASEVKMKLSDIFGEETDCFFIGKGAVKKIKVYEIDRQKDYDYTCAVAVQESAFLERARYDFADLEEMVRLLRAPGGCPWDRAQTSETIKNNMIEEAYELVDAIERADDDGMEEETGDVLLQAAFHSVLSEERGAFTGSDALSRVVRKLIFRHSHIFGKDKAASENEALGVWEKNKVAEKGQKTYGETLLAVPKNFPACMRAQKVGKRAAKCGFDFLSSVSASEKLWEEVHELIDKLVEEDKEGVFEEAGDVLFSAVNTCRLAGVDCEEALRAATDKFIKRFLEFEKIVSAAGRTVDEVTKDGAYFDYYWMLAKNALKEN